VYIEYVHVYTLNVVYICIYTQTHTHHKQTHTHTHTHTYMHTYMHTYCLGVTARRRSVSSYYCICATNRAATFAEACPHTTICVLILLCMCPRTPISESSYYYMCPHTTIYVSSYSYTYMTCLDVTARMRSVVARAAAAVGAPVPRVPSRLRGQPRGARGAPPAAPPQGVVWVWVLVCGCGCVGVGVGVWVGAA
jgi:hypothetical protein